MKIPEKAQKKKVLFWFMISGVSVHGQVAPFF
jgi:hypothetical protein